MFEKISEFLGLAGPKLFVSFIPFLEKDIHMSTISNGLRS
jgi:hypothetical protein